ncbi:MAG: hypothetical protein ABIU63_09650 [Chitinophagaceae bacterium]
MNIARIGRFLLAMAFVMTSPLFSRAGEVSQVRDFILDRAILLPLLDTLPPAEKAGTEKDDKPATALVKEVPKARKQAAPLPVKIQVKPIQVIKPKIIKPVIRIIH